MRWTGTGLQTLAGDVHSIVCPSEIRPPSPYSCQVGGRMYTGQPRARLEILREALSFQVLAVMTGILAFTLWFYYFVFYILFVSTYLKVFICLLFSLCLGFLVTTYCHIWMFSSKQLLLGIQQVRKFGKLEMNINSFSTSLKSSCLGKRLPFFTVCSLPARLTSLAPASATTTSPVASRPRCSSGHHWPCPSWSLLLEPGKSRTMY